MADTLITNVTIYDGSGTHPFLGHISILGDKILNIFKSHEPPDNADAKIEGHRLALAPGFIDTHTHDDLALINSPELLCKLSQGVTTAITGNCGISASPIDQKRPTVEPMNLLGDDQEFYETFDEYRKAVENSKTSVNVAALIGHTTLRQKFMHGSLDRAADDQELDDMIRELRHCLDHGSIGLSTGLAYSSAINAPPQEIHALASELRNFSNAVYTTHLRSENDAIMNALQETFEISKIAQFPIVVSHLKCAETRNWGRSAEVLLAFENAMGKNLDLGYDCYPYTAGSTVLDLNQVTSDYDIRITWSTGHPQMTGRLLSEIAQQWSVPLMEAARKLQPAGAIYHCIDEDDMRKILTHPLSMIGSDGLPNDRWPHPRLWGTFPRVLAYCRKGLMPLSEGVRKMTRIPACRYRLSNRGLIEEGYFADLVMFDPDRIEDKATFENPIQMAEGVEKVWVNGVLAFDGKSCVGRAGKFLTRE